MPYFTTDQINTVLAELRAQKIRLRGGSTSDQGWRITANLDGTFDIWSWNEDQEKTESISANQVADWLQRLGPTIIARND